MSSCTDALLESFSKQHFTYINQIFGDQTIRQLISEVFPNKKYSFEIEETGEEFEHSFHHILFVNSKSTKKDKASIPSIVCSVKNMQQNTNVNINDTLCQSYSLLTYFNIDIDPDQKQKQLDMIQLYRHILNNRTFIKKLDEIIIPENNDLWTDYTKTPHEHITMNKKAILKKIKHVLTIWKKYGYYYFIGNGKCPKTAKMTVTKQTMTRNPTIVTRMQTRSIKSTKLGGKNKTKRQLKEI
jgi:hypothetical protein